MTSYAHSLPGTPKTLWEPLRDHLDKVAKSTADFADYFGARPWGEILGRCHDLGKLSNEFQLYLSQAEPDAADAGAEEDALGKRVDHSTFGSRFVYQAMGNGPGELLAFCIAGHHTGLPDESSADDGGQRCTLRYKLDATKYRIAEVIPWADLELPKRLPSPCPASRSAGSVCANHTL
jgi:CRISPR-associated endonuclease/helicase Cas3